MLERRVYATVGGQSHEVNALALLLGVGESGDDFLVLQDAAVSASAVNLHQVLINDAAGADVEVTYLGVAHLSVGQAYVLAACLELRMRIVSQQAVPVGSGSHGDYIVFLTVANAPTVQNH